MPSNDSEPGVPESIVDSEAGNAAWLSSLVLGRDMYDSSASSTSYDFQRERSTSRQDSGEHLACVIIILDLTLYCVIPRAARRI